MGTLGHSFRARNLTGTELPSSELACSARLTTSSKQKSTSDGAGLELPGRLKASSLRVFARRMEPFTAQDILSSELMSSVSDAH